MIYLVTGFMRTGTSMLMQACEAGGMRVVRSERRDHKGNQPNRHGERPNPVSLYEPSLLEMQEQGWPRKHDGSAIKVPSILIGALNVHCYDVVMMRRDAREVSASYARAYEQEIPPQQIDYVVTETCLMLANRRDVMRVRTLDYAEVLTDPNGALESLRWPMDVKSAAAVIDPAHRRFMVTNLADRPLERAN